MVQNGTLLINQPNKRIAMMIFINRPEKGGGRAIPVSFVYILGIKEGE